MATTKTETVAEEAVAEEAVATVAAASYPAWVQAMYGLNLAGSAHMFLIHGEGVDDYIQGDHTMRRYLEAFIRPDVTRTLKTPKEGEPATDKHRLLLFYNRARGISFGINPANKKVKASAQQEKMRDAFDAATGRAQLLDDMASLRRTTGAPAAPGGEQKPDLEREPAAVMPLFEKLLAQNEVEVVLVIEAGETLCPDADFAAMSPEDRTMLVLLRSWGQDDEIGLKGHVILVTTQDINNIHRSLREATTGIRILEVPAPNYDQRLEFTRSLVESFERDAEEGAEPILAISETEFAGLGAGLPYRGLEDIFLQADFSGQRVTRALVLDRKREMIKQSFRDVLELLDPEVGYSDLGGMGEVKAWFKRSVIDPIREGNLRRAKKGVLLAGPAGTGKTKLAESVAFESGVNCVILNPGLILDHWVGGSEKRMLRALNLIQNLGRAIVFIDEIDALGFNRSSDGDSGVGSRLFKMLMEFMGKDSNRGRIFVMAATNRPDLLDAAMIRDGRFDLKIPILPPTEEERREIIPVLANRWFSDVQVPDAVVREVAAKTERAGFGWTGAELQSLVLKAWEVYEDERVENITEAFDLALKLYRPTTEEVAEMSAEAVRRCNDWDLLPASVRKMAEEQQARAAERASLKGDGDDDEGADDPFRSRRRRRRDR